LAEIADWKNENKKELDEKQGPPGFKAEVQAGQLKNC
jgi:hypothetical protein